MKIDVINPKDEWKAPWTETLKAAAREGRENALVGERLVYDNDHFSVWTIHLLPGQSLPFHRHKSPYFYTALTAGMSRSFYLDGKITETRYQKGDTKYFADLNEKNSFVHNLENIGNSMLIFSTVVFKVVFQ